MDQNFLRHPRNLVYNADPNNSANAQYNMYTINQGNNNSANNNGFTMNRNTNNEYHGVYNADQNTTNSVNHNVYNREQNINDNSDHNIYRTDQNVANADTNQNIYNAEQTILNNAEQRTEQNIDGDVRNIYNSTAQNFIEKPNEDDYDDDDDDLDVNDGYYSNDDEEQNIYPNSNVIGNLPENIYNANENIYNTANPNTLWGSTSISIQNSSQNSMSNQNTSSIWDSTSNPIQKSGQDTKSNQNTPSIWNSTSNSIQNSSQNSMSNQNTSTWNSTSNSILNSAQNTMSYQSTSSLWNSTSNNIQNSARMSMLFSSEVDANNSNQNMYNNDGNGNNVNENVLSKNDQGDEDIDESSCHSYDSNNQCEVYDTKLNNTTSSNQVSNYNINTKHKNDRNQHSDYNAEQNYIENTEQNISHGSRDNFRRDDKRENVFRSDNNHSKVDLQKQRADMIIVLSLLQDMCTAIEYTESSMEMPRTKKSQQVSDDTSESIGNKENFDDKEFDDEEFDDDEFDNEEYEEEENERSYENKQGGKENPSAFRFSLTKDDNYENEQSFEELSDESDELNMENKQHISVIQSNRKNKIKRKSRNQRKNIRNVFLDKQLDAKTQLLREKEQERLQRLGLKQSIENTGKLLRASVKTTVSAKKISQPIPNKKPSEVICLDSDSDDDYQSSGASKTKSKEPILVLSSDSEEGEDGSGPVFDELVQSEDYYSELGLHTNDALNVCDKDGQVLVNVNHNKEDKDIFLHSFIGRNLKPHQIGGVRFLYDNLIESVSHFRPDEGNGCLLAHAMGLGKTIQTITFIDLFLRYTSARKVLCVVPVNTIQNWMNEFNRWLPAKHDDFNICDYVPKVTVPKVSTPKSKKMKKTKKQEEDNAIIQDLLEDMVDFVVNKQMSSDVTDVVSELLNTVCKDEQDIKSKPADPVKPVESDGYRTFHVFLIDAHKNLVERAKIIEEWDKCGGVLLAGYEMYRSIAMYKVITKVKGKVKKGKKLTDENGDVLLRLKKAVCKPGPDLVVCDEGHRIRNYQSGISQALKSIKTRKRLVLTGYPLQNNLIEYWCMVDFVRPNYLGSRQEFSNMFERPIMNGQCVDSTPKDKHLMKQRAHVLYSLLQGFVQRRGHDVFNDILPNKEEHVLMIRLAPIQKALYNRLIELTREAYNDSLNPVKTFSLCCKIWNHPDILYDAIQMSQDGKKVDIISDQDDIVLDDASGRQKRKRKQPSSFSPLPNGMVMGNIGFDPYGTEAKDLLTDIVQWAGPIFKSFPYALGSILNSGKFFVLKTLLDQTLACGDKMLVFSQSLLTLNAIEMMLQKNYRHMDGSFWKKGRDYFRLDGGTNTLERERMINSFNNVQNKQTHLFVLSTRAGCLGINLVAANRVVVFDVSWNPCHDAQAVCRIYRYGQTKQCHIYRLVSSNTMEKKIYYRQISKQGISDRVVDEVNLTENFSKTEIQSLVIEDWVDEPFQNFSTSAYSFVDPVLVNALLTCNQWITKLPFEHESLLINESSQKLSGSEKRAAKREYEQERMMAQGSHVPFRTYPLQQNFPRNTPIAPVRPFFWRPPLNQSTSWLQNPSTLFHHTVSHNVTVPSSFPSNDPLQILRNGAYTGDHSYTGTEISSSVDRDSTSDYWSLDSQLSSIRSAFSSSNLTNVLNRNRSLLNIGPHNDPLARLTESAAADPQTTLSSLNSITSTVSSEFASINQESTVTDTSCPLTDSTDTSVVQNLFPYRTNDEKSREDTNISEQSGDALDAPLYHSEQSLNFEDSNEFFYSNTPDNSNDTFTHRDNQNTRNFEVIVLDDDEDD